LRFGRFPAKLESGGLEAGDPRLEAVGKKKIAGILKHSSSLQPQVSSLKPQASSLKSQASTGGVVR